MLILIYVCNLSIFTFLEYYYQYDLSKLKRTRETNLEKQLRERILLFDNNWYIKMINTF